MEHPKSAFLEDLRADLTDPDFKAEYVLQSLRINAVDRIVNALEDQREALGVTKAAVARAIGAHPAAVRRLLSARGNPTLGTVSDVAAALGLELALVPADPALVRFAAGLFDSREEPAPRQSA